MVEVEKETIEKIKMLDSKIKEKLIETGFSRDFEDEIDDYGEFDLCWRVRNCSYYVMAYITITAVTLVGKGDSAHVQYTVKTLYNSDKGVCDILYDHITINDILKAEETWLDDEDEIECHPVKPLLFILNCCCNDDGYDDDWWETEGSVYEEFFHENLKDLWRKNY